MDKELYNYLLHKTNERVMIDFICPYSYQCISSELSVDIRSFNSDMRLIEYMYNFYHRPSILYTDLMYYMNNTHIDMNSNMPAFFYIIRRFYPGQKLTDKDVAEKFYKICYEGTDETIICNRINRIVGMLTPNERSDFINRYLLT